MIIWINLLIKSSLLLGLAWVIIRMAGDRGPTFRLRVWQLCFWLLLLLPISNQVPLLSWEVLPRFWSILFFRHRSGGATIDNSFGRAGIDWGTADSTTFQCHFGSHQSAYFLFVVDLHLVDWFWYPVIAHSHRIDCLALHQVISSDSLFDKVAKGNK